MSKKGKAAEPKRQAGEIRGFNYLSFVLHRSLSGIMSSFRLSLTFRIAMHYCWQLLSTTLLTALIVTAVFLGVEGLHVQRVGLRALRTQPDQDGVYSQMILQDASFSATL